MITFLADSHSNPTYPSNLNKNRVIDKLKSIIIIL